MTYKEIKIKLGTYTWEKFIRCAYAVANHTAADEWNDISDAIFAVAKGVYCCGGMTDKQYQQIADILREMAVNSDSSEWQEILNIGMELQDTLDPTYQ